MVGKIAADAPLDDVTFQILPENRYDVCVCSDQKEEVMDHGPLDQLLEHLANLKDHVTKMSQGNFKLEFLDDADQKAWFTKATLTRFLHIIGSHDSLNKSFVISKEMSQLEETRKFHLSLYAKAEDGVTSSDNSKNELLWAMDSRLAVLMEELVTTFNLAAGATVSFQEMMDLQKFCQNFGEEDIRNLVSKLSDKSGKGQVLVPQDNEEFLVPLMSKNDYANKKGGNICTSDSSNSVKHVKYNASPAKAAKLERQSSTESEDSSFSSEDDQPSVERSRTLIRSASPRRSASPMRRIQIGRSGPRRTPALTIKSLTCFPARERISSHWDAGNGCEIEESGESNKKTEVNATRMSVQDAISLFENKQKDQDTQKSSFLDSSTNAKKLVLRRWSSGMGESQKSVDQNITENTVFENNSNVIDEGAFKNEDLKPDMSVAAENLESKETVKIDNKSETSEKTDSPSNEDHVPALQPEKINGKMDSVEWSRQKEAELSQMLMKFTEYKNAERDNGKKPNSSLKQKGGFAHAAKESRTEKLRSGNAGKRVLSETRAKQKVGEKPKTEKSSVKVIEVGKKRTITGSQNVNKNLAMSPSSKKDSPKPVVAKKVLSKASSLPATRKSWPSTPLTRTTGPLSTKIPTGSPVTTASRQKPQSKASLQKSLSPASLSQPSPKLEKTQLQQKDVKKVETKKNLKRLDDGKKGVVSTSGKTTKSKPALAPEEVSGATPAKAVVRKKVTKKSSVVPLEAKPSTRKASGTSPASNLTVEKTSISTQTEETVSKFENPVSVEENAGASISETMPLVEGNPVPEIHNGHLETQKEMETVKCRDSIEEEASGETPVQGHAIAERMTESPAEIQPIDDPRISPSAWIDSNLQDLSLSSEIRVATSPPNHEVVTSSEPRVRLSLSQMLLEESSEPDIIEWGNAENPPTMVHQKDASKGLKRLLKFARKNKGETNGTSWASPYTSEGEDDGDECKTLGKRDSENLLRKVALHSKNYGEGFLSDAEPHSARLNASSSSVRSSNKFQEGHSTSKGARSFFSLSAFRGNKN